MKGSSPKRKSQLRPPKKRGSPTRRFSRLYRCLSQPDTKVVLSLGGGGVRMAAHVAVIRFLETIGAKDFVSEVWGTSGGSIVGLPFAYGQSSDEIEKLLLNLAQSQKTAPISPSLFSITKNVLRDTLFSTSSKENLRGFHDIQGVIHHFLGECVKTHKEVRPFYCLAYNLKTNQTEVLTPHPIERELYGDWIYQTDPLDAVIASSSVPILFVPKTIEDKQGRRLYVDGATNEEIPTVSVYKKWLRDRELGLEKRKRLLLVSVNLNAEFRSLGFLDNWLLKALPVFQYVRMTVYYADLMRRAKIQDQKRMLMSDPSVEFWDIQITMQGGGLLNVGAIPNLMAFSEKNVPEQFQRINDSLLV